MEGRRKGWQHFALYLCDLCTHIAGVFQKTRKLVHSSWMFRVCQWHYPKFLLEILFLSFSVSVAYEETNLEEQPALKVPHALLRLGARCRRYISNHLGCDYSSR